MNDYNLHHWPDDENPYASRMHASQRKIRRGTVCRRSYIDRMLHFSSRQDLNTISDSIWGTFDFRTFDFESEHIYRQPFHWFWIGWGGPITCPYHD
ncbi:hypothetical protein CEXT_334261 [Caerostris extrusa]|uniref:Uncharacterized protein n=1 Tax=Caerostris extrusa TaxID=172846 RepID=A0AAV4X665_CAEEX|nr:hypothetical protein CEXT_334261 [Caerostris extrusa]